MTNPWLGIPLTDYEAHMKYAPVQQLDALSELFASVLAIRRPHSVAILGIAGGNGLDRIDTSLTHRLVGFDINQSYLDAVKRRYSHIEDLELVCTDLSKAAIPEPNLACDLVHAALVFEHAGVGPCLDTAVSLVAPGGALSVVLQLPSEIEAGVGRAQFASIENLRATFTFIDPDWLTATVEARGFTLQHETRRDLASGKAFWMGIFARAC